MKLIRLTDYNLQPCNACEACFKTKKCVINDNGEKIYRKIFKADEVTWEPTSKLLPDD